MQSASRSAVDAIRAISGTINRISEIAAAIASVEQQGVATTLITRNVRQASDSVDQVSGRITTVARASTETEVASGQVAGVAARQLSQHATQLKADVSNFVLRGVLIEVLPDGRLSICVMHSSDRHQVLKQRITRSGLIHLVVRGQLTGENGESAKAD